MGANKPLQRKSGDLQGLRWILDGEQNAQHQQTPRYDRLIRSNLVSMQGFATEATALSYELRGSSLLSEWHIATESHAFPTTQALSYIV
eukprot:scaffold65975_cov30-Prasinocladus_malaysianus.AAC.2